MTLVHLTADTCRYFSLPRSQYPVDGPLVVVIPVAMKVNSKPIIIGKLVPRITLSLVTSKLFATINLLLVFILRKRVLEGESPLY